MQIPSLAPNIDKTTGFPACQRTGAPGGAALHFADAAALRYGNSSYVTSDYYTLITPPVYFQFL